MNLPKIWRPPCKRKSRPLPSRQRRILWAVRVFPDGPFLSGQWWHAGKVDRRCNRRLSPTRTTRYPAVGCVYWKGRSLRRVAFFPRRWSASGGEGERVKRCRSRSTHPPRGLPRRQGSCQPHGGSLTLHGARHHTAGCSTPAMASPSPRLTARGNLRRPRAAPRPGRLRPLREKSRLRTKRRQRNSRRHHFDHDAAPARSLSWCRAGSGR